MKLTDWAKKQGISYRSAWNMFKNNQIDAYQLPTGTIIKTINQLFGIEVELGPRDVEPYQIWKEVSDG